jgi:hypothetical protein
MKHVDAQVCVILYTLHNKQNIVESRRKQGCELYASEECAGRNENSQLFSQHISRQRDSQHIKHKANNPLLIKDTGI